MLASRRWRDWYPSENLEIYPEHKPTKPPKPILSVSSVPTQPVSKESADSDRIPPHDSAESLDSFLRWLDSACVCHPRVFGGVTALHRAYCEWEIARGTVPCNREKFVCLLEELSFLVGEIDGVLLVSGLTFKDDLESVEAHVPLS